MTQKRLDYTGWSGTEVQSTAVCCNPLTLCFQAETACQMLGVDMWAAVDGAGAPEGVVAPVVWLAQPAEHNMIHQHSAQV